MFLRGSLLIRLQVWPPNASLYPCSTCVHLRLLAGPFDQGLSHSDFKLFLIASVFPLFCLRALRNGYVCRNQTQFLQISTIVIRFRLVIKATVFKLSSTSQNIDPSSISQHAVIPAGVGRGTMGENKAAIADISFQLK